jgi:hypothetical protein
MSRFGEGDGPASSLMARGDHRVKRMLTTPWNGRR